MKGDRTHKDTSPCPACGAPNRTYASFCISCGEPFDQLDDGGYDSAFAEAAPQAASTPLRVGYSGEGEATLLRKILARRETLLGLVALVVALGFAIYDMQKHSAEDSAFRAGLAAEQSRDWNKAAGAFEAAGDRPGADAKARNAQFQVDERDRHYIDGLAAAGKGDWSAAAKAFDQVQAIQPSFADSASRLVQARAKAARLDLGGIVYQVSDGGNAGLYLLDDQGNEKKLPGSDGKSAVRAASGDGKSFIYDRAREPEDVAVPGRTTGGTLSPPFDAVGAGRVPIFVTLGDSGQLQTQALPSLNGDGNGVIASEGIWWYSGWYSTPQGTGYAQYELFFVPFTPGGAQPEQATEAFGQNRVIALDPPRSRLVLAQARGRPGTPDRETLVYLTGSGGESALLLNTFPGDVQSASVSRNGRWFVVVTRQTERGGAISKTAWAVSLPSETEGATATAFSKQQPKELETLTSLADDGKGLLSAAFVPSSALPTRVMVDRLDGDKEQVSLYELDGNRTMNLPMGLPVHNWGEDTPAFSSDGQYFASPHEFKLDSVGAMLGMFNVTRPDWVRSFSVGLPVSTGRTVHVDFSPRNNYLVAAVPQPDGSVGRFVQGLYVSQVGRDGMLSLPSRIATSGVPAGSALPKVAMPGSGSVLVYVSPEQELRAVTYDGQRDVPVASSVGAVWALGRPGDLEWAR